MSIALSLAQKSMQLLTINQIQSLEILQFSNVELETYIYEKVNENPLLTMIEPEMKHVDEMLHHTTVSYDNYSHARNTLDIDFIPNQVECPYTFLLEQIPLQQEISADDLRILKYLIYNLNEKYFLDLELKEVAALFHVNLERVECILKLLQTFEPIGIGARNVQEYLLIQIEYDQQAPPLARSFVENHLVDVANLSVSFLAKHYEISIEETKKIIQYICKLKLTPYVPCRENEAAFQIPDIVVEKIENEWIITIQHPFRPILEINNEYVTVLKNLNENDGYYQHCLKDALLLIQGIEQRDHTLYSLMNVFVRLQRDFFEQGIEALKPLRLKDVAEVLSLHESTISRAIRQKYIKVPHGIYALQELFVKGIVNQNGEVDSVLQIKKQIQQLVESEDKQKPLSDQQLMQMLNNNGFQISRRTIAKYRQELNIPSSSKRSYLTE